MAIIGLTAHILTQNEKWNGDAVHGIWVGETTSITLAGGKPIVLPPVFSKSEAEDMLKRLDGLLLLGGGDVSARHYGAPDDSLLEGVIEERDESELALTRAAITAAKPLLAICRGVQLLNVALGGTLIQDIPTQVHGALKHRPNNGDTRDTSSHAVQLLPGTKLQRIFGESSLRVNSYHHQALNQLGQGLEVTAKAADGIIEGVELRGHPFCVGVQWHPEFPDGNEADMQPLFRSFVNAARAAASPALKSAS